MIKSIRLQNFFGFQDCTINLEKGENVLVGINGSGKSNFFKAIWLLYSGFQSRSLKNLIVDTWGGRDKITFWGSDKKDFTITYNFDIKVFQQMRPNFSVSKYDFIELMIKCEFVGAGDYNIYSKITAIKGNRKKVVFTQNKKEAILYFRDTGSNKTGFVVPEYDDFFVPQAEPNSEIDFLWNFCQFIQIYDQFDVSELSKIRFPVTDRKTQWLSSHGEDLTRLLRTFKRKNHDAFANIQNSLSKVNSNFTGIDFKDFSSQYELEVVESFPEKSAKVPASNLSDGTLRFLCLMAILYNPNRGTVICIDEPELGFHPDMINTLYRAIEHAAETSQIIISTHSAHLLDYFELKNVRVFEKNENNATEIEQFTDADFKGWYKTFNPGQMWRAGDIGGNRW